MNKKMNVHILNTDLHYKQEEYNEIIKINKKNDHLHGWKNDILTSQICITSYEEEMKNIDYFVEEFVHENGIDTIDPKNVMIDFVRPVKAYSKLPNPHNLENKVTEVPQGHRETSPDVLYSHKLKHIPTKSVQFAWLKIFVPKDTVPGNYTSRIQITADGLKQNIILNYEIEIYDAEMLLPQQFKNTFDIELWQNPFAVAEYYEVETFSQDHFERLIPHMELYKKIGGDAVTATIVEEAWAGQTYSKNKIKFPSMVKWTKNKKGQFEYNYTYFDKWIEFCRLLNLGEKIVCYSLAPWTNTILYFDENENKNKELKLDPKSTEYREILEGFLIDFIRHVEKLKIKDNIYLGIDERGFNKEIFKIIESVKGKDNKPLKVAGALDSFIEKKELSKHITDLTVGTAAIKNNPNEFEKLVKERKSKNLRTTIYSCTGHVPGNFSLSEPMESYWTILFSYAVGGDGFLRWAYDSWVKNPLVDSSHFLFEAGDTFLVYPDKKDALNPKTKSSVRLEKMLEGMRDVQKLNKLKNISNDFEKEVNKLLLIINKNYSSDDLYLDETEKKQLQIDIKQFKKELNLLTQKALEQGYSLANDSTIQNYEVPKEIKKNKLSEKFLSIIEKSPNTERQYLGQPDMIMLNNEKTLITVYPIGHGAGPIIMQISNDAGKTWKEKLNTPESWQTSLETPTIYKLNLINGETRLLLISGRPNWKDNTIGGWDTSISLDEGTTWSEFKTHHSSFENGKNNYSMVAMSSLIQLKDETGKYEDKWLGIYHDENFINYKTYLTFDENGIENWTAPEPYLAKYRIKERLAKICEVCLIRSPDESKITAIGRSQSHEHPSVIFHSYNEGKDWTKPAFLPIELYGERHKAAYIPGTEKLAITFREMKLYKNNDQTDWKAGNWVLWVGEYEDLINDKTGELLLTLAEDYTPSIKGGDTGYAGIVVQSDGTIIANSYGHWDKEFSKQWLGSVTEDLSYIKQAKFRLNEL